MIGTGSVLRSEPASDVTPVTVLERQPHRIYHQLREVLRLRLGERHANLLAEPLAAERGLGVQWRAPLPGNARAHGELSEADQGRAAELFSMLRHEFAELARTLQLSPKREEARFGEILAMSVPSPRLDSVYWIADQPVSTCWGTTQASRELTAAELVRDGPVNEPALRGFDAPQIEAVRPAAPPAPALRREERPIPAWLRLASLAREVWRRPVWLLALPLLALAALLLACLATARPRLLIPLDAPTTAELSFLVGRWRVSNPWFETDSQDVGLVHLPLRVEYWFGSEGVGEHRVQRANGEVCKGPAFAVFTETGALRIETERTQCTREAFRPEVVLCMRATETTRCVQDDSDRDGGDDLILERVLTLGSSGLAACDLCGWLSWRDRGP